MSAKWGMWAIALAWLMLSGGCRTTQPDLKPGKEPERFASPPDRLNTPGLPKSAFDTPVDPAKNHMDSKHSNGVMPTRGVGAPGGGGGMGGR